MHVLFEARLKHLLFQAKLILFYRFQQYTIPTLADTNIYTQNTSTL